MTERLNAGIECEDCGTYTELGKCNDGFMAAHRAKIEHQYAGITGRENPPHKARIELLGECHLCRIEAFANGERP